MSHIQKRILTVGPDYRYPNGGIAKLINTYSSFFEDFGFVATMRAPEQGKESIILTGCRLINGLAKMAWKILFKKYKIIHIHTASGITFYRESLFLYFASFLGVKTILHIHSGILKEFYEAHPKFMGRVLGKADKVVTIAKVWEKYLNEKGHFNVTTIGNPINRPHPIPKGDSKVINVSFLGLICDNKGIWDILNMMNNRCEELKGKIKLRIGGNGEVKRLQSFISDNNLSEMIEYMGWIDEKGKPALLSNTDIYLQPSYREALGIAILEAMSYKIPIIATNTGGIPEIVHHDENGYLITPGDQVGLFLALRNLCGSPEKRLKFGENGSKIAEGYYPDAIKQQLIELYKSIE